MGIFRSAVLAALLAAVPAAGQFGVLRNLGHAPQAAEPEEFDRYLEILAEGDADGLVRRVAEFASAYPDSELLGLAYQHQLEAFVALDDLDGVLAAGRAVLELLPDNLAALVTLALSLPNRTADRADADKLLDMAEGHARRALEVLDRKQIPRAIAFDEWMEYRSETASKALEALGHVAAKRGDSEGAVDSFERATRLSPEPLGRQHFRLGVAYTWVGRFGEARAALETASRLGPEPIRRLASLELAKLDAKR